jgi:hypothetical protein
MPRAAGHDPDDTEGDGPARSAGVRHELRLAVGGLLFGVLVLPFLIYGGGAATLGPYEGGLMPFLEKLYGDIAHGAPGALALVLGPYLLLQLLRLTTRPLRKPRD